jgi:hypothetical protein
MPGVVEFYIPHTISYRPHVPYPASSQYRVVLLHFTVASVFCVFSALYIYKYTLQLIRTHAHAHVHAHAHMLMHMHMHMCMCMHMCPVVVHAHVHVHVCMSCACACVMRIESPEAVHNMCIPYNRTALQLCTAYRCLVPCDRGD